MSVNNPPDPQWSTAYRLSLLENTQAVHQERLRVMSEEINDLKKDLREAKKEIIDSQRESLNRIIYVQGSILLAILGAVITIAIKVFFH